MRVRASGHHRLFSCPRIVSEEQQALPGPRLARPVLERVATHSVEVKRMREFLRDEGGHSDVSSVVGLLVVVVVLLLVIFYVLPAFTRSNGPGINVNVRT